MLINVQLPEPFKNNEEDNEEDKLECIEEDNLDYNQEDNQVNNLVNNQIYNQEGIKINNYPNNQVYIQENNQVNNQPYNQENNQPNNQIYNQTNNQLYNQTNNQVYNQHYNITKTSNNKNLSNCVSKCIIGFASTFLCLEVTFCTLYIFGLLFALSIARYPDDNKDDQEKYLKRVFIFGFPCSVFPCIIIGVSFAPFKPIYTFFLNFILILGKSGLFAGFFYSLYKIKECKHKLLLVNIALELGFDVFVIINEIVKLICQKINNKNNN